MEEQTLIDEFLETMSYDGDVHPWQQVPETDTSEDEPGGFKSLGGPGSGNFNHAGRPGSVGGSGSEASPAKWTNVVGAEIDDHPLARYVGGGGFEYQESLRYDKPLNSEEAKDVAELDKLIAASVTKTNLVVYRTVPPNIAEGLRPGQIIKDKGFVSTSLKPDIKDEMLDADVAGEDWVTLRIFVPKGTPILDVNAQLGNHYYRNQREMILPRNTKFAVTPARSLSVMP